MKRVISTAIRALWAIFLIVSAIYCLLAYLPYTYFAFIKAPAYPWMPWLAAHHPQIFLAGVILLAIVALWERPLRPNWYAWGILIACSVALLVRPVLAQVRNDGSSFWFGIAGLLLLPISAVLDNWLFQSAHEKSDRPEPIGYALPAAMATSLAIIYNLGIQVAQDGSASVFAVSRWVVLLAWTIAAHLTVAVVAVSVLNLATTYASRFGRPHFIRIVLLASFVSVLTCWGLIRILSSALGFDGLLAWLYAAILTVGIAIFAMSLLLRWTRTGPTLFGMSRSIPVVLFVCAAAVAFFAPRMIRAEEDWNGILQQALAVVLWLAVAIAAYSLSGRSVSRSHARYAAIGVLAAVAFAGLRFSEIAWAKPLGATDDEITRSVAEYSAIDASFRTAHTLLGGGQSDNCDERCRVFRQHSNIRHAPLVTGFDLVENLQPSTGKRPNIFIWVIDSLRPDYLGAYNPKVDFTPNFDEFARDSVVLRNTYTQYAGTTLSVPAIWAGAEILHTHYPQPFDKINSLLKLARIDDYQLVVSRDTVLNDLLPKTDNITNIEPAHKLWMNQEMCASVGYLDSELDRLGNGSQPIMFFSQPMNLHQFAINDLPLRTPDWTRPGFDNRVSFETRQVDQCFGRFTASLKKRGMYDNSIIVVTSDHGDALGEYGRHSHSITIYPEIMRVPLLIHLPKEMEGQFIDDENAVKTLTDLTPTLYYITGHRGIKHNPLFGRPLLVKSKLEIEQYQRHEWLMASDAVAVYGILGDDGRFFYAAYDSPARSYLYDLKDDPAGTKDILTPQLQQEYDRRIIDHLNRVADFYGYRPGMAGLFTNR
jgi:hypothetical protein